MNTRTDEAPRGRRGSGPRQKQTARGKSPRETYHFELTPEDTKALKGVSAWFEQYSLDYSASCLVRLCIRETERMLQAVPADDASVREIVRRIDAARGVDPNARVR